MELKFITNEAGVKQSVVLPFSYWQQIENELKELRTLLQKSSLKQADTTTLKKTDEKSVFEQIETGLKQVKEIQDGKLQKKTFKQLLNEE